MRTLGLPVLLSKSKPDKLSENSATWCFRVQANAEERDSRFGPVVRVEANRGTDGAVNFDGNYHNLFVDYLTCRPCVVSDCRNHELKPCGEDNSSAMLPLRSIPDRTQLS